MVVAGGAVLMRVLAMQLIQHLEETCIGLIHLV